MMHWLRALAMCSVALLACKRATETAKVAGNEDAIVQANNNGDFVTVKDGHFELSEKPFLFMGSNFYRLGLADAFNRNVEKTFSGGSISYPQIDKVMENYSKEGIRVVRVWGFACEDSRGTRVSPPILHRDLSFDDHALEQLDFTLAAAARHGVKVILPLVNFEPEYCGWEWWVESLLERGDANAKSRLTWSCVEESSMHRLKLVNNPADCRDVMKDGVNVYVTRELFLTDSLIKDKYKDYIKRFLSRTNRYTGQTYSNDPTIMSIELSNEPHTSDYYECLVSGIGKKTYDSCNRENQAPYAPGTLVANWLNEMASFVKSIDQKHLVSSGEEGYRASHEVPTCRDRHQWINDGSKGADFAKDVKISSLDFMTTHLYPDNWAVPVGDLDWFNDCIMKDRVRLARENGKPIIMEESGFSNQAYPGKPADYANDRPYYISKMFRYATMDGFQGTMIWQAAPLTVGDVPAENDSFSFPIKLKSGNGYAYTPDGLVVAKQIACMNDVAAGKSADACPTYCKKGVSTGSDGTGKNADGTTCVTTSASGGGGSDGSGNGFPTCPAGTSLKDGWGWSTASELCATSAHTKEQLAKSGGCSCKG